MFELNSLNQNEKLALLVGILLGDGCLSRYLTKKGRTHFAISIVCNYHDDMPFFKEVVAPLINSLRDGMKSIKIVERPKKSTVEILFSDKKLFYRINSIGFPVGKKGSGIEIPKIFFEKDLLKYVIQGFFATDGSFVLTKNPNKFYPRIEGNGISRILILQIYNYLKSKGMIGGLYDSKRNKVYCKWKMGQQQYRFQFNGKNNLLVFERLIGFVNPKHYERFIKFIEYDKQYTQAIRGVQTSKHKQIREAINLKFMGDGCTES